MFYPFSQSSRFKAFIECTIAPIENMSEYPMGSFGNLICFIGMGKERGMTVSIEDVKKVAQLARLALTNSEQENFKIELNKIVEYIEQLNKVDVQNIPPMTHAVGIRLVLRPDEVGSGLGQINLHNSAALEDGFVRVPKVIE